MLRCVTSQKSKGSSSTEEEAGYHARNKYFGKTVPWRNYEIVQTTHQIFRPSYFSLTETKSNNCLRLLLSLANNYHFPT